MRILILIITILFSGVCFGQETVAIRPGGKIEYNKIKPLHAGQIGFESENDTTKTPAVDSMDLKVISMNEFNLYLERISIVAMKQFNLTEKSKYDAILKELLQIQAEADKKRRK